MQGQDDLGHHLTTDVHDDNSSPPSRENIKVFLRLRPVNKKEKAKRSKDCIELHDSPGRITVESPLSGSFDFQFDAVFDEFASNEEVYRGCASSIPEKILRGVDCTFFSYGQSKTGKSHSIFGEGRGVELGVLARESADNQRPDHPNDQNALVYSRLDRELDPKMNPRLTMGVLPRLVTDLFEILYSSTEQDSAYEFTIRCSFVEIYVEKMTDLIQPGHEEERGLRVGMDEDGVACVFGATELCCLSPQDVFSLVTRGMASRTKDVTNRHADSNRSHAVFTLRLSQVDRISGRQCHSRLQILDLAGSEEIDSTAKEKITSATTTEGRMLNSSLAKFHAVVRDIRQRQQKDIETNTFSKNGHNSMNGNSDASSSLVTTAGGPISKLAKLLKPSIGGTTFTVMLCTGSSSNHNIDETIRTLSFGQQVRQVTNVYGDLTSSSFTLKAYKSQLLRATQHEAQLLQLIRLMAQECKHGKSKKKDPKNPKVWRQS